MHNFDRKVEFDIEVEFDRIVGRVRKERNGPANIQEKETLQTDA